MKIDATKSQYHERDDARVEWTLDELKRLRFLLRRLRFLEANIIRHSEADDTSNAAVFAETEAEALRWLLDDIGYLDIKAPVR